jgi:hypothetical protein
MSIATAGNIKVRTSIAREYFSLIPKYPGQMPEVMHSSSVMASPERSSDASVHFGQDLRLVYAAAGWLTLRFGPMLGRQNMGTEIVELESGG